MKNEPLYGRVGPQRVPRRCQSRTVYRSYGKNWGKASSGVLISPVGLAMICPGASQFWSHPHTQLPSTSAHGCCVEEKENKRERKETRMPSAISGL